VLVVAAALEADVAVQLREQRVVHAEPHVGARAEPRAPLPDEDAAGGHELPAEALDAQHLRIGIPAVPGAADTLFVRHGLDLDPRDAHRRERLAMPVVPAVVLPPLELDDQDLALLALAHDLAGHP